MKKLLAIAAAALFAAPALAEVSVNVTPISGVATSLGSNGQVEGVAFQFSEPIGGVASGTHVYDNLFASTPGLGGPVSFYDWIGISGGWGDDIHADGGAVANHLHYLYFNDTAVNTHVIRIYNNAVPHSTITGYISGPSVGVIATSIVMPSMPFSTASAFMVTVSFPTIAIGSNAWVTLWDAPTAAGAEARTFWGTGGNPGIGFSHDGGNYDFINYPNTGYWVGGPITSTLNWNSQVALGIPGPASIGLFAAAGLVSLGRRRRK